MAAPGAYLCYFKINIKNFILYLLSNETSNLNTTDKMIWNKITIKSK